MVIITAYVARHELKPLRKYFTIDDILTGAEKVIKKLATEVKPPTSLEGCRFFKVRIGKRQSGRMIVFFIVSNQKVVPLLIRLKKDKIFGMNMATNNPQVVEQLKRNLDRVLEDIEKKRFEEL